MLTTFKIWSEKYPISVDDVWKIEEYTKAVRNLYRILPRKNQSIHIREQASNEEIFLVYFNVDMG